MEDLHGLLFFAIVLRVADKVPLNAVGLGLDEGGAFPAACSCHSLDGGLINLKDILAVDDHAGHVVALGAVGDILHGGGGTIGGGGGPAVHLIDEDDGEFPGGSHIRGLVEGAAVGGAVAEEHDGDGIVLQNHLVGQGRAGGEVIAAADHTVGAEHADGEIRDVHAAALAVAQAVLLAEDLSHHLVHVRSLGNAVAVTAVRALNQVGIAQRRTDTGADGLLTDIQMHESGDLAIEEVALHRLLKAPDGAHGFIELFRLLSGNRFRQCSHTFLKLLEIYSCCGCRR